MIYLALVFLIIGVIFLWKGSDFLISSTKSLSLIIGIPSLLISITVIAFGTSLPELVVGVFSGIKKVGVFSLGNIIGSSIANLGLVLALSSIVKEIEVDDNTLKRKYPFSIGILVLLFLFFRDLYLDRIESLILIGVSVFFLYVISKLKLEEETVFTKVKKFFVHSLDGDNKRDFKRNIFFLIIGIGLLILGGKITVEMGVLIAKILNVPSFIIGFFLVSFGTVLPEFLTSFRASLKGHCDIAFGNVIGSCIINTSFILGVVGLISPFKISTNILKFYLPFYLFFVLMIYLFLFKNRKISKKEGFLLLVFYLIFILIALYEGITL